MKCAIHPEVESVAFCGQCGRALCAACKRDVQGMVYCETCLTARLQSPLIPPVAPGTPQPGLALFLGFFPGVGAMYNGQIVKGLVQVLIFGSLIALSNRVGGGMDAIFGLAAFGFYCYMVIDSYQTARRKCMGLPTEEWLGLGDFKMNAPVGAAILIGLGVLFLLDNFGIPIFSQISKFWPLLLIAVGLLLLQRRMGRGQTKPPAGPTPGPNPSKPGPGSGPHSL